MQFRILFRDINHLTGAPEETSHLCRVQREQSMGSVDQVGSPIPDYTLPNRMLGQASS